MYDSMVFYRSFYEAVKDLEPEMQGHIYSAIFAYGLDGEDPKLSGVEKSIFTLIKPQIDANNRRKENGKKGAKYGELGGRPKEKNPKKTPEKPQENPKETPNVNVNVNVNDNVITNKGEFKPPTIEEVEDYCKKRGNNVNAEQFVTYYAENDWYLSNGKKMKSWKSSVITWEQNRQKAAAGTTFASYKQRETTGGNPLKGFLISTDKHVDAEEIKKRLKNH